MTFLDANFAQHIYTVNVTYRQTLKNQGIRLYAYNQYVYMGIQSIRAVVQLELPVYGLPEHYKGAKRQNNDKFKKLSFCQKVFKASSMSRHCVEQIKIQ